MVILLLEGPESLEGVRIECSFLLVATCSASL